MIARTLIGLGAALLIQLATGRAQELPEPVLPDSLRTAGLLNVGASLLVPGTGQIMAGQERGALYLVAEAFLLTRVITRFNEGRRERDRYRELALTVARREFAGSRVDTVFDYYDKLGKFLESGPFDEDPGPALVPPMDSTTFNGSIWLLARRTFLTNPSGPFDTASPEYREALQFYRTRAVGPGFLWSWRNARLEQDLYRQTIASSDEAFRRATSQLGLLLLNHLLSAADAFISHRLEQTPARLRTSLRIRDTAPESWNLVLEVGLEIL